MAKDFGLSHYTSTLFLVLNADPKVAGHDRPIGADGKLSQFKLLLSAIQHAGIYKTQVWDMAKFFAIVVHCFLDLDAQGSARVVVKP